MKIAIAYWIIGLLSIFLHREPQNIAEEERSIFIFLLMFIVVAWPVYWMFRLARWNK